MEEHGFVEVLICGAGVAGLTLAIDLARRGVPYRLIDKLPAPFAGSRGKAVQPRTLEVFEDLGIVDRIAAVGGYYPSRREYRTDGTCQEGESYPVEPPTAAEPYRTGLLVPQLRTEGVMRERLAEFGHTPRYGCELLGFEQDDDGVTAHLSGAGRGETLRCRHLIGGDGGRSFVRHALGVDFPGRTLGVRAIVADITLDGLGRDAWYRFNTGDADRQIAFCPLPHGDLFQLQARIPLEGEVDLSAGGLQAFVEERVPGRGLAVRHVAWASDYSMNARLAERFRVGRVFLMGDAAHVHPPTGGQGLNTSVQDAYNLGWKLEAALAGAADDLLDSYEAERRPIAAGMLGLATGLLEKIRDGDTRRGREVTQLDLGYGPSALTPVLPRRERALESGERAPDAPLRGAAGQPRRLFELFRGPHWTLLVRGGDPAGLPASGPRLRVHQVGPEGDLGDPDDHLGAAYGMEEGDLLLVRPDGYVAALTPAANGPGVGAYLARWGVTKAAAE